MSKSKVSVSKKELTKTGEEWKKSGLSPNWKARTK